MKDPGLLFFPTDVASKTVVNQRKSYSWLLREWCLPSSHLEGTVKSLESKARPITAFVLLLPLLLSWLCCRKILLWTEFCLTTVLMHAGINLTKLDWSEVQLREGQVGDTDAANWIRPQATSSAFYLSWNIYTHIYTAPPKKKFTFLHISPVRKPAHFNYFW